MKFNKKESIIFNKLLHYLCIPFPIIIICHLLISKESFPDRFGLPIISIIAFLFSIFGGFIFKGFAKVQMKMPFKNIEQKLVKLYKAPFALLALGYIWGIYKTLMDFIDLQQMNPILFMIPGLLVGYKIIVEEILGDEVLS